MARAKTAELEELKKVVELWGGLEADLKDLAEMAEMAEVEGDQELGPEIEKRYEELSKKFVHHRHEAMMSGEFDDKNAVLMIHAGTGGVDAQDWAEMLRRMYLRYAENKGWRAEVIDESRGSEAGIKSSTIEIKGPFVYGNLRSEAGIHRLVRLSPFNADNLRQTSFALVEVVPEIGDEIKIDLKPEDLRIDTFRSQGHGGQGVNTTDSAVRITHLPTNIVVTCQNERSQLQNKETAIRILKARLYEKQAAEMAEKKEELKGGHVEAKWGNQIRSYVLHPYKMVKDHRTNWEEKNAESVLDGKLDNLVKAYLEWDFKKRQNRNNGR